MIKAVFPVTFLLVTVGIITGGLMAFEQERGANSVMDGESVLGVFTPRREAILSAEVNSSVVKITRDMGEGFSEGEPLVELDRELFEAKVKQAQVDRKAAQSVLATFEKLYKDKSKSLVEVVQARRNAAAAEFNLVAAKKELDACTILAPYRGRVVKRLANEHELVTRGRELVSIVDDSVLRLRFLAPEKYFNEIVIGQAFSIRLNGDGGNHSVDGKVTQINHVVDSASGTFEVVVEVDNSKGDLAVGLTGRVALSAVKAGVEK